MFCTTRALIDEDTEFHHRGNDAGVSGQNRDRDGLGRGGVGLVERDPATGQTEHEQDDEAGNELSRSVSAAVGGLLLAVS
jgi:hypothetical protein